MSERVSMWVFVVCWFVLLVAAVFAVAEPVADPVTEFEPEPPSGRWWDGATI